MAPGVSSTFSGFLPTVFVNAAGQIAFTATTVTGAGFGLWAGSPTSLQLVATNGFPAPGTNGQFSIGQPGLNLGEITAFNDAGQVALSAGLQGAPNDSDRGLWMGTPGALQLVARTGSQAPGFPTGVIWTNLGEQLLNEAGQVAFVGNVSQMPPANSGGVSPGVIVVGQPGSLQVVARSGDQAPQTEPDVYLELSDKLGLNAKGEVAFRVRLVSTGAVIDSTQAIYVGSTSGLKLVAREDFPAPGVEADAVFSQFDHPVLNRSGEVAFNSFISSAARPSGRAVWTGQPRRLRLVARTGDVAPGTGGLVFSDLPQNGVVLSDSGQVAFIARFGTDGNSTTGTAVFATDKTGPLRLIARVGTSVGGGPVIDGLQFCGTLASNGDGRRTPFDAAGRLLFYANTFSTGNSPGQETLYQVTFDPSAPVIPANGQPASVAGVIGGSATFSVAALGSRPATYQWKRSGQDLDGKTEATLTLTNLTEADRGAYTVVITNAENSVTSAAAQLTFPPAIGTQPIAKSVNAGSLATLRVLATGPGTLSFLWQFKATGATTFTDLTDATQATLSRPNVAANQAGKYRVVVSNADGATTSVEVALTVAAAAETLISRVFIPGDPARGIADRSTFSNGENAVLNNAGELAFEGRLTGVDFSGGAYVRQIDGTFRHLTNGGFNVNLSDSGDTAARKGNGLVIGKPDAVGILALDGTQAPGSIQFYRFSGGSVAVDDDGTAVFSYALSNGAGNFIGKPGNVAALALTGQQAPGLQSGVVFNGLGDPVINPAGTAGFFALLSGTGITAANDTSLWTGTASGVQRVVAEGDDLPAAGTGVKIGEIFFPFSGDPPFGWNAAGKLAFQTELTGTGVTTENDNAILAGSPGALAMVVREGVASGHRFDLSLRAFPVINSAGQVAFTARVIPTGQSEQLESLWLWTPGTGSGILQLIAREGQQVPGLPAGITFDSADLGRPFFNCSLNGAGQLVFKAFIAGPGISFDTGNDNAIFLTKPSGEVKLVVRAGNSIDLGGGELRNTQSPNLPLRSGGEDGRRRSLSEDGEVVFSTGLEKPASLALDYGIFTARLPGTEPTAPEVFTQSPSGVSETGATLRATVNPNRGATTVYFEYGTSTNYGQVTTSQLLTGGTSPIAVSAPITGLTANTTYHYRVVATNSADTTEGSNVSFAATTGGGGNPPSATIAQATNRTETGATLNGSINRQGESVSYYFEYGTTTNYGQRTPTRVTFPGTSAFPVSEAITGLTSKTTYQFRLVASSLSATVNSSNGNFVTRAPLGDFTIAITDLANGTIVSPQSRLRAGAAVKIPRGSKTKIGAVQFFVDGVLVNTAERSAYKVEATVATPGLHTLIAVGVATNGTEVESAPVTFTVSEVGAGPLALTSSLTPTASTAAPGALLTYRLFARNSSNTGVKNVELSLLVPVGSGYVETRFVDANGQPIATPKGATITFNGANGTVTVEIKEVKAFASFTLQLRARVPFDQVTTGNVIAGSAFTIKATQVRQNFTASFPSRSITVNGSLLGGTPRPILGIFVSQSAAGELPSNPSIVTVTKADRRLGVPGVKPKRTSNQIVYRLHFANYGDAPARSVRLVAPVPPGTTYKAKSAAVIAAKGDSIPVFEPIQFGNLLFFDVPSLEAGYFSGNLGSAKTLLYTVDVNDDLALGDEIAHEGAAVTSGELLTPVTTNTRKLARVVAPEQMTYGFTRQTVKAQNQAVDSAEGTLYHTIFYANQGGLSAKEVGIRYTIPPGLALQSASFVNHLGAPVPRLRTQGITAPIAGATSGNVTFSIGTVASGKRGAVQVVLKLDPASRPAQVRKTASAFVGYDSTTTAPTGPTLRAAKTRAATPPGSQPNQSGSIPQQAYDPTLSRLFVLQSAPAAVSALSEFDVLVTWGNLSATRAGVGAMHFLIPAGTELVSASATIPSFENRSIDPVIQPPGTSDSPNGRVTWGDSPEPNSILVASIRLRVKPGVLGGIKLNEAFTEFDRSIGPIFCAPLTVRIVPAGVEIASQRAEVYNTLLGQGSSVSLGTAASPNTKFVQNVELVGDGSRALSIAGADYAHIAGNGGIAIPLGGGRMVAAGGGNFVNQATASMVAAGGGNLVAAGGGNMQITVPGSGFVTSTQLISTAPSLVAAGGMNLVAAGGLNLLRKVSGLVGNDGASLIGMDGSTLVGLDGSTLGTFSQRVGFAAGFAPSLGSAFNFNGGIAGMVAARGGNVLTAGGGHLVAAGGGNVFPPFALVGNDGASVIGGNGASLIGDYSAGLIGNDGSTLIGNDGSTLVAAGGGNFVTGTTGLVNAGGLNNQ